MFCFAHLLSSRKRGTGPKPTSLNYKGCRTGTNKAGETSKTLQDLVPASTQLASGKASGAKMLPCPWPRLPNKHQALGLRDSCVFGSRLSGLCIFLLLGLELGLHGVNTLATPEPSLRPVRSTKPSA